MKEVTQQITKVSQVTQRRISLTYEEGRLIKGALEAVLTYDPMSMSPPSMFQGLPVHVWVKKVVGMVSDLEKLLRRPEIVEDDKW